jgi:hypothetical protein
MRLGYSRIKRLLHRTSRKREQSHLRVSNWAGGHFLRVLRACIHRGVLLFHYKVDLSLCLTN